jgi:hypothetical protein
MSELGVIYVFSTFHAFHVLIETQITLRITKRVEVIPGHPAIRPPDFGAALDSSGPRFRGSPINPRAHFGLKQWLNR